MPIALFALVSLSPALLLAAGFVWGGVWLWLALLYITLFAFFMDRFLAWVPAPHGTENSSEFPADDTLLATLAMMQFFLLALGLWALSSGWITGLEGAAGFVALGLWLGQIGNSAAHELIHRRQKALFWLGRAMFISVLFGHHTSAHRLVHHPHVATPADPNSPRRGQTYYGFLTRAWWRGFVAGYQAEKALLARQGTARRRNPYAVYLGAAAVLLALVWQMFGGLGLALYVGLALHAQSQILLSDYVQHYGLRRSLRADGRYEPVGPAHSWNGGQWFTGAMMLNAPRHSDHHAHPARPYPQLALPEGAPLLPAPLPAMAVLALVPPLWRRVMHPRLDALARA